MATKVFPNQTKCSMHLLFILVIVAQFIAPHYGGKIRIFFKRSYISGSDDECRYYFAVSPALISTLIVYDKINENQDARCHEWIYEIGNHMLSSMNDSSLCLALNQYDYSTADQEIIFDALLNELFWNNPLTKTLHVIHIKQSTEKNNGKQHQWLVAVNDMDLYETFGEISKPKTKHRLWRKLTGHSLNQYNETSDLPTDTNVKHWVENIKCFLHNNVTFGVFKTKESGFLIGDGNILSIDNPQKTLKKSSYKCYGLSKIHQKNGRLIDYLFENYAPILNNFNPLNKSGSVGRMSRHNSRLKNLRPKSLMNSISRI